MAQQTINIGSSPNDGTGDTIRDAMDIVNDNFNEMYTSFTMSGAITVGNSTVNSVVSNTGGMVTGNTTANATANSLNFVVANTIGASTLTPASLAIGNSTVNTSHSVSALYLANSISNVSITTGEIFIGNSTVNVYANSSYIEISSANLTSNTLTLGSSTDGANGYTYLPNGFKMNWGKVSANSSEGTVTFSSEYTTNAYVITATSNAIGTYAAAVISQNNTGAEIRTANDTATDVYFNVIGK